MNRNIVYLLGAGLTKSLEIPPKRIPLMYDFIAVLADRLEDEEILTHLAHLEIAELFPQRSPEARRLVIELLVKENESPGILEELKRALKERAPENIETLIETAARAGAHRGSNPLSYLDRSELDDPETGAMVVKYFALGEAPLRFNFAINSYFAWVGWDLKLDLLRTFLSRQLALPDTRHTCVSFNYDLSLDRVLQSQSAGEWDFADGYGFPIRHFLARGKAGGQRPAIEAFDPVQPPSDRIQLLKPHGSLNWLLPFDGNYQFHREPVVASVDAERGISYRAGYSIDRVAFPDGRTTSLGLFLYPPFERKTKYGFIQRVVEKESQAIREADEIYVVGWSLPMTDSGQVHLISEALRGRPPLERVTVVNYGAPPDYFARIASAFQVDESRLSRHNRGFAEYVASM